MGRLHVTHPSGLVTMKPSRMGTTFAGTARPACVAPNPHICDMGLAVLDSYAAHSPADSNHADVAPNYRQQRYKLWDSATLF